MGDVAHGYARYRLPLVVGTARAARPTVYFLTPDHGRPAGGIRVIYRHVDILNACGIAARVLHRRPGFRCTWFEHDTQVTDMRATAIRPGDLLVVPEIGLDELDRLPPEIRPEIRHVIFNQNTHLTWSRAAADHVIRHYRAHAGLAAVVCVSRHNRDMLRQAFPDCPLRRIHLGIDPAMFRPGVGQRPRRIAYMPRRGREDAQQVFRMLEARGLLDGWEIVALDGLPHHEVAERLRTARIFLAFTRQEGFGLPAAEAMACGAYVVGNDGFAGREFFRPEFCTRVEAGDMAGFARAVADVLRNEAADPDWCASRGARASQFVLKEYSPERERADVVALYGELLAAGR